MNEASKSCYIISSEVILTSSGSYSFEAKYDTLAEIKEMMNSMSRFAFQIPQLTASHFLGPDITSFSQDADEVPIASTQKRAITGSAVLFILLTIFSVIIGLIFYWQRKSTQTQYVDVYNRVEEVDIQ